MCDVDLTQPGIMRDIVSNALILGLAKRESEVNAFLEGAQTRYSTGQQLLQAAAKNFNIKEAELASQVQRFEHCNCQHGPLRDVSPDR